MVQGIFAKYIFQLNRTASMSENDFGAIPVPFRRTGQDLYEISVPFNLVLVHQKNPVHVKNELY